MPADFRRRSDPSPNIAGIVPEMVKAHPCADAVTLVGSRAEGQATPLSDWDFEVVTSDFQTLARDLPELLLPLEPLGASWDRLAIHATYMLVVGGPTKIDLIFEEPWTPSPPHEVTAQTLPLIDMHFWDWTLWLAAKQTGGKDQLVRHELAKMHEHLLTPMGVVDAPDDLPCAVRSYGAALRRCEARLYVHAPRELADEVQRGLREHGILTGSEP